MDNKTLIIIGIAAYFFWKSSQKKNTDNTDDSGSGTSVEQDSGDGSDGDFTELDDVMVETHTSGGNRIVNNGGSNAIRNGGGNTAKQDFRIGMLR